MKWRFTINRPMALCVIALAGCLALFSATTSAELTPGHAAPAGALLAAVNAVRQADFCGEPVPLERRDVRERFEKELLLALWDRPQVILWLKRGCRYLPAIGKILHQSLLPEDLKFVAVAESALRPHAGSAKGAVGFWQFMASTGRKFGLIVNERIDQRRNLAASTQAAARYFKHLHRMFGSWTLAAAAFNMGEEGLQTEILDQGIRDYYALYLPLETQRFVLRIVALKLIMQNPQAYGFALPREDCYPPVRSDQVRLRTRQELPLKLVAQAAGTHFKMIKDLNPEIRGHYLGPGKYDLRVPAGRSKGFHKRLRALLKTLPKGERIYIVKRGDHLSGIAARLDIPLPALIRWNKLDPGKPIHPGDRLVIKQVRER